MINIYLENYYIPALIKNELAKIEGIDLVIPSFDESSNLTIDFWFNKDWNTEIKHLLLHLNALQDFKITSLQIAFKIRNIHIKFQRKNC